MRKISFHYISDEYITHLRSVDPRIMDNKHEKRPYIVLGVTINDLEYYIPFSSPKFLEGEDGYKKIKKPNLYKKLYFSMEREKENGEIDYLGILRFSNMIVAPLTEINYIDFSELFQSDRNYAILLTKQFDIIQDNFDKIVQQASLVYQMNASVRQVKDPTFIQRRIINECCDFQSIEQAKIAFETRQREFSEC